MLDLIDLRSDTSTMPTEAMRRAMAEAEVGNADFGEDPTINRLEARAADLLGKEDAVFVLGGTMGNLVAVMSQTEPGDSVLIGERFHVHDYEGPAMRRVAQVDFVTAADETARGLTRIDPEAALAQAGPSARPPRLLSMENTVNAAGGTLLPLDHMAALRDWARARGMAVHLDGARFFNACCALGTEPRQLAATADTVQFVCTKSLSAPAGAIMAGPKETVARARKFRWMLGGNWKQGGVVAAACLCALDSMCETIPESHGNARRLAEGLAALPGLWVDVENVVSNILFVHVTDPAIDTAALMERIKRGGARIGRFKDHPKGKKSRLVTHKDIDRTAVERFLGLVKDSLKEVLP